MLAKTQEAEEANGPNDEIRAWVEEVGRTLSHEKLVWRGGYRGFTRWTGILAHGVSAGTIISVMFSRRWHAFPAYPLAVVLGLISADLSIAVCR